MDVPSNLAFRGEPGEVSPDAAGGWSAGEAREYLEWSLREHIRQFAAIHGWEAADQQTRQAKTEDC
jgi:hypothetical protein